jgi:beta-aspartyl-dipeptidase (metallo-type)
VILTVAGGELYDPSPRGTADILALNGTIALVGDVDAEGVSALGVPLERLDASDCVVVPGFIDPHVHLIGGSGERGHGTWTPEIFLNELVTAGVTTVVGCLGVDTTMKNMAALVGKARGLREEQVTAFVYSGGYDVPPATLLGSVRRDMLFVEEVIGAGEIAIADHRGSHPSVAQLAHVVADAHVGGLLSGKAGVTHFHVGDGRDRLGALWDLLDRYDIAPECLYPSHVERHTELLHDAADLSTRGVFVDVDTVAGDLPESIRGFVSAGGDLSRLTVSSDASITPPRQRLDEFRRCAMTGEWPLETLLPLVTTNPAAVLKLKRKGRLDAGCDADIVVLRRNTLEPVHVVARGRVLMRDGRVTVSDQFLQGSARRIRLDGSEAQNSTRSAFE